MIDKILGEILMEIVLYLILIAAVIGFFIVALKKGIIACYFYAFASLMVLAGLFIARTYPDIILRTPGLEYERKVDQIITNQTEMKNIVTTLIKMSLATEDGSGRFGDNRTKRDILLKSYKKELESYLPPDMERQVQRYLDTVNTEKRTAERNK